MGPFSQDYGTVHMGHMYTCNGLLYNIHQKNSAIQLTSVGNDLIVYHNSANGLEMLIKYMFFLSFELAN